MSSETPDFLATNRHLTNKLPSPLMYVSAFNTHLLKERDRLHLRRIQTQPHQPVAGAEEGVPLPGRGTA